MKEKEWSEISTHNPLKIWLPIRDRARYILPTSHYVSQVLTGHGNFPQYLNRFKIKENCQCTCGKLDADSWHYVLDCPKTNSYREKLETEIHEKISLSNAAKILTNQKSYSILKDMAKFIITDLNTQLNVG